MEQGHIVTHKVWRFFFLKSFYGTWRTIFGKQIYRGAVQHGGLMIRSSCQGRGSSAWGSKWVLPWGLLCRTSGKRKLCMVPCHICHIYGIWRRGGGCLKSSFGRGNMQPIRGRDDFNGEGGLGFSLYVILLCWNFIVTRYCKRFRWILPFPRFLLFHLLCILRLARPKVKVS